MKSSHFFTNMTNKRSLQSAASVKSNRDFGELFSSVFSTWQQIMLLLLNLLYLVFRAYFAESDAFAECPCLRAIGPHLAKMKVESFAECAQKCEESQSKCMGVSYCVSIALQKSLLVLFFDYFENHNISKWEFENFDFLHSRIWICGW